MPCCELFGAVLVSLSVFVCLCAVRFLEVQLSSQCRQLEEELQAARTLAGRPQSGRPATAQQEVRARTLTHNVWGSWTVRTMYNLLLYNYSTMLMRMRMRLRRKMMMRRRRLPSLH